MSIWDLYRRAWGPARAPGRQTANWPTAISKLPHSFSLWRQCWHLVHVNPLAAGSLARARISWESLPPSRSATVGVILNRSYPSDSTEARKVASCDIAFFQKLIFATGILSILFFFQEGEVIITINYSRLWLCILSVIKYCIDNYGEAKFQIPYTIV